MQITITLAFRAAPSPLWDGVDVEIKPDKDFSYIVIAFHFPYFLFVKLLLFLVYNCRT